MGMVGWIWLAFLVINAIAFKFFFARALAATMAKLPVEAVVYALDQVAVIFRECKTGAPELKVRSGAIEDLEIAARAVEVGLGLRARPADARVVERIWQNTRDIAHFLRELQIEVLFPNLGELAKFRGNLEAAIHAAVCEDWAAFPHTASLELPREGKPLAREARGNWKDSVRSVAAALLPAAVVVVAWALDHTLRIGIGAKGLAWAALVSVAWAAFTLLRQLDPELIAHFDSFRSAIADVSRGTRKRQQGTSDSTDGGST
jgi:hypothetical protein